ncbi:hypothetical protein GCM10011504_36830 [Siccirubricoccus deserti]|nr:hypothetical protein [Siccirubricoccus deserti]GGC55166.1 hypothetical protein GCM10011504_36830 [Siccirubricoccus deserti]
MTHELLAMVLGVRRAGITVLAGALQKAGLIHSRQNRIEVTGGTDARRLSPMMRSPAIEGG